MRIKDLAHPAPTRMVECASLMGEDESGGYELIRRVVQRLRGVDLNLYRSAYVLRRIRTRLRARRAAGPAAYAQVLAKDPEEITHLLGAISTKVTSFFRDPALYTYIDARVLPELMERSAGRALRFWSAGCATGEEAYSLAALVAAREPAGRPEARILGTDVDKTAIAAARRGEYPMSALRRVPADIQRRFFTRKPDSGTCRVSKELSALTSFRVETLLDPPPAGAFDLVLCRNVFIYFETALQQRILEQLASAIRAGGFLALGRVERILGPARASFEAVHMRERIYRRI